MNNLKPARPFLLKLIIVAIAISVAFLGLSLIYRVAWGTSKEEFTPITTEHQKNNVLAEWSINSVPAKVLTPNTFIIELQNNDRLPVTGAELSIELSMIGMLCGNMAFDLAEQHNGTYIGEGYPLMPGKWQAKLTIKQSNEETITFYRTIKAIREL